MKCKIKCGTQYPRNGLTFANFSITVESKFKINLFFPLKGVKTTTTKKKLIKMEKKISPQKDVNNYYLHGNHGCHRQLVQHSLE